MNPSILQPELLSNELVYLVPLGKDDFELLFNVAADPLIWEQHPSSDRYKREVFQLYFDGAIESRGAFLIYEASTNELMGCTRFYDYNPDQSSIAIGYTFIARKYWGGEYNKAVKKLLLDHAFKFVDVVIFHVGPSNLRSQNALLKIGAKRINIPSSEENKNFVFEIKKENWLATK